MAQTGRIPLWIVATIAGTGVLVVVGLFFYGAYVGVGSAMQGLGIETQPNEKGRGCDSVTTSSFLGN